MFAAGMALVFALVPVGAATDLTHMNAEAEREAAAVLCVEAGHNAHRDTDRLRGALIAHVIDKRVKDYRVRLGMRGPRSAVLLSVLREPHQWGRDCALPYAKLPGWIVAQARRLVRQQMHFSPAPDWLTDDVLFVVSASEVKRLEKAWAGKRTLVRVMWNLAFYRNGK